jgi:catechol 2,3-dioxygenase-like lactoylglutathione lyase family enzyme
MTTMIDHVGISVTDYARSRAFYNAALEAVGIKLMAEFGDKPGEHAGGYGKDVPTFWLGDGSAGGGTHVAFTADSRAAVDAFYAAALAAGGRDNGGPGLRTLYHPNYYAAFVYDPDGHNIEAVCHAPE